MSTFYLLPPRPALGDRLAGLLQPLLPGLDWDCVTRSLLADWVGQLAEAHADVYVVFREDLPDGEPTARALANGFGAAPGDEVVEVRLGPRPGELVTSRWRVAPHPPAPSPTRGEGEKRAGAGSVTVSPSSPAASPPSSLVGDGAGGCVAQHLDPPAAMAYPHQMPRPPL